MANRYTEYNPQQYISTYVPLPLEEIAKVGAMKQQQFDTGKAEFQGVADMIKIKSDPHREAIRDQLLSSYNNEINTLADEYTKTGDNSLISKVNDLKRRYANDQVRLGLEKSAANYDKLQKDAEEYKKTGKYADFYDPYNNDSAMNPDGSFKAFDYTGMLSSENINEEAKKQMGKIAEDGSAFEGMVRDKQGNLIIDPQGAYWSTKSSGSGVKEAKVVSLAKAKADSFLGSEAGRYFIDKQFGRHINYDSLDNNTKNQLKTLAAQYLVQASAEQIGWTTKSGNDAAFTPWAKGLHDNQNPVDPWTTFTPQQPGTSNSKDDLLTSSLPQNVKEHMMYKDGKLVSKQDGSKGFWSTIWDNVKNTASFIANPGASTVQAKAKGILDVKNAVEAYKDIKPLLLNYGIVTGKLKPGESISNPEQFKELKDSYANHLADAIIANREVAFDQTTSDLATKAILPTVAKDGSVINPNLMGSTTVYNLDGSIVDGGAAITGGGKILGPDSKHNGRLLIASRDGKQYSIDPNIPDLKLTTKNINDFDAGVIDRIATGSVTSDTQSLKNYYSAITGEIDKINADPKIKENIKLTYINNINALVNQGYKMTTVYYGGNEVPVAIKYNDDGTTDKKVIAEAPGLGATIMDIGEYKSFKTQESYRNAGILPQLNDKSNKQYEANTIR